MYSCGTLPLPCVRLLALADAGVVGKVSASLEMQLAAANMALAAEKQGRAEDARLALSAKTHQVHRETVQRLSRLAFWESVWIQGHDAIGIDCSGSQGS